MPVHMVTEVAGQHFQVTLSRDDAGNYVAEAVRQMRGGLASASEVPCVRVVHPTKERAMESLLDLLHNVGRVQDGAPLRGS